MSLQRTAESLASRGASGSVGSVFGCNVWAPPSILPRTALHVPVIQVVGPQTLRFVEGLNGIAVAAGQVRGRPEVAPGLDMVWPDADCASVRCERIFVA
jgi:hypothetical protein